MAESRNSADEKFERLTTASIPGLVGKMAVPTIISMLITSLYNMADTFFVGNLGTSAQGAVGVVFSLMAVIQAIGFTFGNGAGVIISGALGKKEQPEAERAAITGFFGGVTVGLLLTIFGLLFTDKLVHLLGATDTILPYARDYAHYILIGAPWMIGSLILNNILRFGGNTTFAMVGITSGGILNILLDPIFIFGLHLGISGAALATILSQFVSFVILLFSTRRDGAVHLVPQRFIPDAHYFLILLKNGMPSLIRQGMASFASILLNWAAKPYTDAAIAAMAIVSKVTMFCNSALIGFGQGFQPVCGFNYGAKLYNRVRDAFRFCVKVGTGVLAVIALVGVIAAPHIVWMFQGNDAEVVRLGSMALRCQLVMLVLSPYVMLNNMMLQTVGESFRASVLALARQGLFFVPFILIFPPLLGFTGVMISQPISDICSFLLAIPLSRGFMKKMRREEEEEVNLHKNS